MFLFFFTILVILIFIFFYLTRNKIMENYVFCNGCVDVYGKCHPGTVATRGCNAFDLSTCYVFYDENGNVHTPCGLLDKTSDQEKSCSTCSQCIFCKKSDTDKSKNKCIPKIIFQIGGKIICDECPLNDICLPGNDYII